MRRLLYSDFETTAKKYRDNIFKNLKMEHVHEPSDDSYCTTDEGNSRKDDGEEPYSPISDDKIGEENKSS